MFSLNELKIFFYIDTTDFTAYICHLLHLEDLFVLADFRSSCPEVFYKKVFSCEFCEISNKIFSYRTPTAASVISPHNRDTLIYFEQPKFSH